MLLVFSAFRAKENGIPIHKTVGGIDDQAHTLFVFGSEETYRKFEKETLSSKSVIEKMRSMGVQVVVVNMDDAELVKRYSVTSSPSFVLISNNSQPRKRDGLMGAKEFMSWLK
jgi:thioredoxin-related protein